MIIAIGMTIGNLTIEDIYYDTSKKSKPRMIKCKCSCGNNCIKHVGSLVTCAKCVPCTISCGCQRGSGKKKVGNGRAAVSYLQHGKHFPQQYLTYLKKKSKHRSGKIKTLDFELTIEFLDTLYEKQNGKCYYTGRTLILPQKDVSFTDNLSSWNVSVDRIDSNRGYYQDNVVLCVSDANMAKQSMTEKDFIDLCKDIAKTWNN
jgi:hypothetical protein